MQDAQYLGLEVSSIGFGSLVSSPQGGALLGHALQLVDGGLHVLLLIPQALQLLLLLANHLEHGLQLRTQALHTHAQPAQVAGYMCLLSW